MVDRTPPGGQLFLDLIAAAGEQRSPSFFEVTALALAAEHSGEAASHPSRAAEPGPFGGFPPTGEEVNPGPENVGSSEQAEVVGLRLIDDEDQPRLATPGPSPIYPGASTPAPGPRVSAFAAATGAAITQPTRRGADPGNFPADASQVAGHFSAALASASGVAGDPGADDQLVHSPPCDAIASADPGSVDPGLVTWVTPPLGSGPGPSAQQVGADIRQASALGASRGEAPDAQARSVTSIDAAAAHAEPGSPAAETFLVEAGAARSRAGGGVLLADDDDFGPLVLPEPARRARRRSRQGSQPDESGDRVRHPRRAGAAVGVLLLALAGFGVWWVTARPVSTAVNVSGDVSMVDWHGIALPVSATAGPAELTDTRAAGFVRTALGAAIAGTHLSVRLDPAAGPEVFEPVLADQVVGARDRLADAVRAQSEAGAADGEPGRILGWRVDGDPTSRRVTAHLAVEHADDTRADYAVPLAWGDGDWRIDATSSGPFFPITDLSGSYASLR